jgi:hypothetical protein
MLVGFNPYCRAQTIQRTGFKNQPPVGTIEGLEDPMEHDFHPVALDLYHNHLVRLNLLHNHKDNNKFNDNFMPVVKSKLANKSNEEKLQIAKDLLILAATNKQRQNAGRIGQYLIAEYADVPDKQTYHPEAVRLHSLLTEEDNNPNPKHGEKTKFEDNMDDMLRSHQSYKDRLRIFTDIMSLAAKKPSNREVVTVMSDFVADCSEYCCTDN